MWRRWRTSSFERSPQVTVANPGDHDVRITLPIGQRVVPLPEGHRYLRIQVGGHTGSNDSIALVGHELRHALEVAESPEVRDEASLIALYERIGHHSAGTHHYDTGAAQAAGRKVKAELAG